MSQCNKRRGRDECNLTDLYWCFQGSMCVLPANVILTCLALLEFSWFLRMAPIPHLDTIPSFPACSDRGMELGMMDSWQMKHWPHPLGAFFIQNSRVFFPPSRSVQHGQIVSSGWVAFNLPYLYLYLYLYLPSALFAFALRLSFFLILCLIVVISFMISAFII